MHCSLNLWTVLALFWLPLQWGIAAEQASPLAKPLPTSSEGYHEVSRSVPGDQRRGPSQRNAWRGWGGERTRAAERIRPIATGYLFIEGNYVEPPYSLELGEQFLTVNDQSTTITKADLPEVESVAHRGIAMGGISPPEPGTWQLRKTESFLHHDNVVLLWSGTPPIVLNSFDGGIELRRALAEETQRVTLLETRLASFTEKIDRKQLHTWLAGYEVPSTLQRRALEEITALDQVLATNRSQNLAVLRFDRWSYLLSMTGMVLVVAGFGHLLSSAPPKVGQPVEELRSPQAIRALVWSLALVVALSALDLIWTILSSQAGAMHELNPMARGLIDDPRLLMVYKIGITTVALGIILALRHTRPAQVGAWWACLICTLLAARWLLMTSMIV